MVKYYRDTGQNEKMKILETVPVSYIWRVLFDMISIKQKKE